MNARTLSCLAGLMAGAQALAQPTITTEPTDQSVSLDATVQFNVVPVSSGGPVTFQWWFKDAALDPALNPSAATHTLTLTNVTEALAGAYWAVLSDDNGTTTSQTATLEVDPAFTKIMEGPVVNDPTTSPDPLVSVSCAWADYDNDGFVDLVMSNDPAAWAGSTPGANVLYRNLGDGTFRRVPDSIVNADTGHYAGCAWADADNDGFLDLFIGEASEWFSGGGASHPYYLRGLGNGAFLKVTDDPIAHGSKGYGPAAWGDYDNDGYVDLFVTTAWNSVRTSNSLFHNRGDGNFTRITEGAVATSTGDAQWAVWSDYDNDNRLDLLVSVLSNPVQLYHNDGDGRFSRITHSAIFQESSAAGTAWGDYDNDGALDLCIASYFGNLNVFHNDGNGEFSRTILQPPGNYQVPSWVDYDNDGYLDLYVPHGSLSGDKKNHLYRNNADGTFVRIMSGSPTNEGGNTTSSAWADYDNNGFLDLLALNPFVTGMPHYFYRNNGNENAWIAFRLVGTVSNRSGIGAKARVQATIGGKTLWQMRELCRGNLAQDDLRVHFGLGDATNASIVRIEWPSGIVQELTDVPARQILTITEHQDYGGAPPRFNRVIPSTVGCEVVIGEPPASARYVLEASNSLVTWTKLLARTSAGGTHEFLDTQATNQVVRFYRLVVP